ncbi:unnamed protein product [Oikopleura dioica]|uniref:Peptidase S1 domain-containing protein n=1 Tax=Oikopleura dioica TaxID=34765 RepID=E4Y5K4_OIKDI|nr:unnamed protein product [Oikopleura dioica]
MSPPFIFEPLTDLIQEGLMTCTDVENGFSTNRGHRIFNGAEVDPNSWPWIVNMFFQTENQMEQGGASISGGTIVHSNWVLTAAHCCEDKARVFGRFGQHNMNGGDDGEFTLSSENFIIHPGRTENVRNNDFCLVKFDNSITEAGDENCAGNCVGIACLPSAPVPSGQACWAAGWGVTELNNLSSNLLSVGLSPLPLDYCLDKSHYFASQIASDNFCAGLPDFDGDGKDTCQGDSGGPLICAVNGKVVLTGVTSWGAECAFAGRPGVYGDVFFVRTWITSIINSN